MKTISLLMLLTIMALFHATAKAEVSLFMDTTVYSVQEDGKRVFFENEDGDVFEFKDVTHPFKVGEEACLEVIAEFSADVNGFKVVTMYYLIPDKEDK